MQEIVPVQKKESLLEILKKLNTLDPSDETHSTTISEALNNFHDKVEAYFFIQQDFLLEVQRLTEIKDHYEAMINQKEKLLDNIKKYALFTLEQSQIKELVNKDGFKIRVKETYSCGVSDKSIIPPDLLRTIPAVAESKEPDKMRIKKLLLDNVEVPGCYLNTEKSIEISKPKKVKR